MVDAGGLSSLGGDGVAKLTGDLSIVGVEDVRSAIPHFPDIGTGPILKGLPGVRVGDVIKFRCDFKDLEVGDVEKLFPELHTGDVLKMRGDLISGTGEHEPVTLWRNDDDEVAIAAIPRNQGSRATNEVTVKVSFFNTDDVYFHVLAEKQSDD